MKSHSNCLQCGSIYYMLGPKCNYLMHNEFVLLHCTSITIEINNEHDSFCRIDKVWEFARFPIRVHPNSGYKINSNELMHYDYDTFTQKERKKTSICEYVINHLSPLSSRIKAVVNNAFRLYKCICITCNARANTRWFYYIAGATSLASE